MSNAKKVAIALIAMLIPFTAVASANAAGETVSAKTELSPRKGNFYKQVNVASNLRLDVEVIPGQGQPTVEPLKNVRVTFPAGMTFRANNKICPDSKLNEQSSLGDPKAIVDACQNAVVGTGTAKLLLARGVNNLLSDPILVAFNAGKAKNGAPKLKIYGYSKGTGVGILMTGQLQNRVLDIAIPVLSYDSAVKNFDLNFPGPVLDRQAELGFVTQGKDPNYVQARCASSPLVTNAVFKLGQRNPSTGADSGPTYTVESPTTTQACKGLAGKAKLNAKAKGPKGKVKRGRKAAFKVTVSNKGTATAKAVKVTAAGGKANAGNIAPGKSKTVTVRAKVTRPVVKFTIKGKGVSAKASARVKLK
jgi:hypothetical protein